MAFCYPPAVSQTVSFALSQPMVTALGSSGSCVAAQGVMGESRDSNEGPQWWEWGRGRLRRWGAVAPCLVSRPLTWASLLSVGSREQVQSWPLTGLVLSLEFPNPDLTGVLVVGIPLLQSPSLEFSRTPSRHKLICPLSSNNLKLNRSFS